MAGLQVVVNQEAIDRAMPLLPATRMTLPLMLHTPQVCCILTVSMVTMVVIGFAAVAYWLCSWSPACVHTQENLVTDISLSA